MTKFRFLLALPVGALLLAQQAPPDLNPAAQPDLRTISGAVRALRRGSTAADEVKAKADKLLADARPLQTAGQTAEARRYIAQAYTLLKGQSWDAKQEFAWSLALRPNNPVSDSSLPFIAQLTQTYSARFPDVSSLKVHASLWPADAKPNAKAAKDLGTQLLPVRDLNEQPFGIDADLSGVADGEYVLRAELTDGDAPLAAAEAPVYLIRGIEVDRPAVEKRLAKIKGHDNTKASIRYPYVLAQTVNVGRRRLSGADFGLPYQPQPVYDFAAGVKTSASLLKSLEAGKDPLYRAKGNSERAYWFAEANEMMAYHVYAPMKWDGKSKLPMVLVLHGNTRDQDYYFDRDDHILARLAEEHGYLVVCPMGYRPSAGWGSNSLNRRPNAGPGRRGFPADPSRALQGEYSEKDALNVLDLVMKEYPVDPARVYLFGHSAGGAGSWYLGQKFPEKWAAIAMSSAATSAQTFPFERLKGMPIMVCHGDKDTEVPISRSRNMVAGAKAKGLDPVYLEVPGGTHLTIVALVEPKVFDFFDKHPRKGK
jgi:poly(3-hydroxybutyrate) depolymerase